VASLAHFSRCRRYASRVEIGNSNVKRRSRIMRCRLCSCRAVYLGPFDVKGVEKTVWMTRLRWVSPNPYLSARPPLREPTISPFASSLKAPLKVPINIPPVKLFAG
jgi:hypothetical protein